MTHPVSRLVRSRSEKAQGRWKENASERERERGEELSAREPS